MFARRRGLFHFQFFGFTEMAVLLRVTVQPKKGSGEEVEEIPECY